MSEGNGRVAAEGWVAAAVSRYEGKLLVYSRQILGDSERARDVVQEVFARLCAADRGRLDGHLAEWLYRVCRNRSLDVRRTEKRTTIAQVVETVDEANGPSQELEWQDEMRRVARLVDALPGD